MLAYLNKHLAIIIVQLWQLK